LGYLRVFPNILMMAPADECDLRQMLALALRREGPCAIRYPKASLPSISGDRTSVEIGKCESLAWGSDGLIIACGALFSECRAAVDRLADTGLDVGLINARFVKPLDEEVLIGAIRRAGFVVTVEEGALAGGFGSAVLEIAADAGLDTSRIRRLGIPDRFIEHAERNELLMELGLDAAGISESCRQLARQVNVGSMDGGVRQPASH